MDTTAHDKAKKLKPGSGKKLKLLCKRCGDSSKRLFSAYEASQGCNKCKGSKEDLVERLTKRIKSGEKSIADYPEYALLYCYDQHDIPEQYRNEHPPSIVPTGYYTPVWWRCSNMHFTTASPKARIQVGNNCGKCSPHTSRIECAVFIELKALLEPHGLFVTHRSLINNVESDVLVESPDQTKVSIEIDGYHFHNSEKKQKQDYKKDHMHKQMGIRTIRLREKPLKVLSTTDRTLQVDFDDHLTCIQFVIFEISDVYGLDIKAPNKLICKDESKAYYQSLIRVPFEESVAHLYPELIEWLDTNKTTITLDMVRPSSDIELPWISPDKTFKKVDRVSNRIRNGRVATFKELTNHFISSNNNLAATHPHFIPYFKNPDQFTSGHTKKVENYCSYPHKVVGNNVETFGQPICGYVDTRTPVAVMVQIKAKGHSWNFKCKHPDHIVITEAGAESRSIKIAKANRQAKHKLVRDTLVDLLHQIPLTVIKSMLQTNAPYLVCPDCALPSYKGGTDQERLELIKEQGGYECFFCFGSGKPITKTTPVLRPKFMEIKPLIEEFKATHHGWKLNRDDNKYALSYKNRNNNENYRILTLNIISPESHKCNLLIRNLEEFDSNVECICSDCINLQKTHAVKEKISNKNEQVLSILAKRYSNVTLVKDEGDNAIVNCGNVSKVNGISIPHADFIINKPHLEKMGVDDKEWCPCCAHTQQIKPPSSPKLFGLFLFQMRYAEALLNIIQQGIVTHPDKINLNKHDRVLTSGADNKLIWSCANPKHEASITTADNYVRINKKGYCKECLKERGFKVLADAL
ncbi:hypothetical protein BCT63_07075 [Vibrio kanaloae]|uniref:zinc-ribbon domain-containing protein n=1 Tax=Vibrio kanaloae TaxID=170673 RepID=UPI000C814A22|nr:zinc-ribbon domain-containing protein [Vibrio kanaloae]PMM06216.1 hypothetical protein BCT63_07075 [Vibrio kanaloae]